MPKRVPRAVVEWVGGTAQMPAFVADESEPWRPEVLFWLSQDGAVVGSAVADPGELLGIACASLREAIAEPAWGMPHAPTHLRVASPELAAVLRAGCPDIEIRCAPTPELAVVIEDMRERVLGEPDGEPSWFSPHVDAPAVAAFFHAAAALYRRRPWLVVPGDQGALYVTIPSLEVFDAPLMVTGQLGESYGLLLFRDDEGLEQFGAAMAALDGTDPVDLPRYLALSYERGADVAPTLRREIAAQHWEVASVAAYPTLISMEADLLARSASARELMIMEVIALALPALLDAQAALHVAWDGGAACVRTSRVAAHGGAVEITIGTATLASNLPEDQARLSPEQLLDVLADMAQARHIDDDLRQRCEALLLAPFYDSGEGQPFAEARWAHTLFDIASDSLVLTLPLIDEHDLELTLFTTLPRNVGVDPSRARAIVAELRAVYGYLGRELGLAQAADCVAVLRAPRVVARLKAALANRERGTVPGAPRNLR